VACFPSAVLSAHHCGAHHFQVSLIDRMLS
jgi:hypothetical protein